MPEKPLSHPGSIQYRKALLLVFASAFFMRMWGITNPLLDFHSWRQVLTATVAKNFFAHDMNILHPATNLVRQSFEYEFPFYTFLVAVLYKLFGFHDIFGRIVSVMFSLGSMGFLFLLTRKYFCELTAIIAVGFYAVLPMSVYYSRTFMPESAMIFFSVAAVYFFSLWLESESRLHFFAAAFCMASAALVKLPALYMGGPLLFMAWMKYRKEIFSQSALYLFALPTLLPPLLWYGYMGYLHARSHGGESLWLHNDKLANWDLLLNYKFYKLIFWTRLGEKMFAFTGIFFLVPGLFSKVEKKEQWLFHVWFLSVCAYFLVVARGNWVHEYYQVPIIPVGTVFIGKYLAGFYRARLEGEEWIGSYKVWIVLLMLIFIPVHTIRKLGRRLHYNDEYLRIGAQVRKYTGREDLVVVQDKHEPEIFYYGDRRGWYFHKRRVLRKEEIEALQKKGAKFFISSRQGIQKRNPPLFRYLEKRHRLLYDDPLITIFRLKTP